MAYDERITELQGLLKSAAPDPSDPNNPSPNDLAVSALRNGIERYAEIRRAALDELYDLINNATVGASGLQDRWQTRIRGARDDMNRILGEAAKDMVATPLQVFWVATLQSEGAFFDKLAAVKTPEYVEKLLTHQGILAQLIVKLQTDWDRILSDDKILRTAEMDVVKDLDQLVQNLTNEIENKKQAMLSEVAHELLTTAKEKAKEVKEKVTEKLGERLVEGAIGTAKLGIKFLIEFFTEIPPEIDDVIVTTGTQVDDGIAYNTAVARAYSAMCEKYRTLMGAEKGVLTFFQTTRNQVIQYEKENNLKMAEIMRNEAKRFLSEWANGCRDNQCKDAAAFNSKIFEVIDENWTATEGMARDFENRFRGVFYAPLKTDTIETLTGKFMMKSLIDSINARAAAKKIEESQKQLAASVDETVALAVAPLEEMSEGWPAELKEAASFENAKFRKYLREKLKIQIDRALNSLGETRGLLDPPKVSAEFAREQLDEFVRN